MLGEITFSAHVSMEMLGDEVDVCGAEATKTMRSSLVREAVQAHVSLPSEKKLGPAQGRTFMHHLEQPRPDARCRRRLVRRRADAAHPDPYPLWWARLYYRIGHAVAHCYLRIIPMPSALRHPPAGTVSITPYLFLVWGVDIGAGSTWAAIGVGALITGLLLLVVHHVEARRAVWRRCAFLLPRPQRTGTGLVLVMVGCGQ